MTTRGASLAGSLVVGCVAAAAGFWAGNALDRTHAEDGATGDVRPAKTYKAGQSSDNYLRQTPAAIAVGREPSDYGLGDCAADKLKQYPAAKCGDPTPLDLYRYAGSAGSSYSPPTLPMSWDEWVGHCREMKPKIMAEVRAYMAKSYDFNGKTIPGAKMSGGKPIMAGPVARLLGGVGSWEELAKLSPDEIKKRDLFPFKPLAHPIQTTAHMVFPDMWLKVHPEHLRMDCDLDIPDAYLPEFPPPLFLTTHKELGDVTKGREITFGNYFQMFDGLITPEQMEGLKELLRPTPTTWFNQTNHRVTYEPSAGVSCFACHVNGHSNGAIELAPDSRPNQARLRVDTPSMRGNFNLMQLSSKRSIRSMDHFAEVEEYFDGDQTIKRALGARDMPKEVTNRMGDFAAIIDFPPAPKLSPLMKLIPEKATASEMRGEALFNGKAQCAKCHSGPAFVDDYMHDLQVERFYVGRPEGPIKTFPLRGIKDSPPYLHDGRCPTLRDVVEFFNIVLELKLTKQETEDLVAYLLCL
jgi:cytochrome c peroxidase